MDPFITTHDPIYSTSRNQIPINGDTIMRKTIEIAPSTTATASITTPFNGSASTRYQFQIPTDTNKFRWGNLALRLKMVFCCVDSRGNVSDLPSQDPDNQSDPYVGPNNFDAYYAPDPFMTFALFDQVVLKINNQSVVYQSTAGTVQHDCASRIMSEYTMETINNTLSDCIFGPLGDHQYTATRSYETGDVSQVPLGPYDPYTSQPTQAAVSKLMANILTTGGTPPIDESKGTSSSTGKVGVTYLTGATLTPFNESNPYACDPCLKQRVENWARPIGSASRVITRVIPFNVLFPKMPDLVFNNVNKIFVELTFNSKKRDLLVPTSNLPSMTALGAGVSVIEMSVLLDSHEMAPDALQSSAIKTKEFAPDMVALPFVQTYVREWSPGGETQITGISNFQSLFVCAPTDGVTNAAWVSSLGTLTDQQVRIASASFNNTYSQWFPFSTPISKFPETYAELTGAQPFKLSMQHDIVAHRARDCYNPLNTIQLLWGRFVFPQNAVTCSDNRGITGAYTWDGSQLYYEHAKAQDRVTNRVFGSATDDTVFNTTMPHILFNPNASGAPTMNNRDSVIRVQMRGGSNIYVQNLMFVVTSLRLFKILVSGEISYYE
jgi:hypothetical protein